ncbi:protein MpFBW2 [Marchantia polymorpha subsp. ruderalis]
MDRTFVEEEEEELSDSENEQANVRWAEMLPETLVEVMRRLPSRELLQTVPQVCKAWRKASLDPACWQVVDLKDWCISAGGGEIVDRMVKLVVSRSCGGIRELRVTNLDSDASLHYLAQSRLSSLRTLCIPSSKITEAGLCELILTLPSLVHLDISKCSAIKCKALEVIGQTCESLIRLDRSMWALNLATMGPSDDSEALAIAHNMPKLKHLEMVSGLLTNAGLIAILDKCPDLEYLDVSRCWNVKYGCTMSSKCQKVRQFIGGNTEGSDYDYDEDDDDNAEEWDYRTEFFEDFEYLESYIEDEFSLFDL